jgi:hypothetical protein
MSGELSTPCAFRQTNINLLIKSQVGPAIHTLATHNVPITYKSLARTENHFQVLETLAVFSNVQPQLQPQLAQPILVATPHRTAPRGPIRRIGQI